MLLTVAIAVPLSVHAGFFSFLFPATEAKEPLETPLVVSATDVPLLSALQNPNPSSARGGAEINVDEEAYLVSSGPVGEDVMAEQKAYTGEIRVYTVREGDTLSQVAEMFDVTANTIMWANDLSRATAIQPGDTLVILPVAGVRHTVVSGDTIASIAKKYDGDEDEILEYNQLTSAADLVVGDELIVPGGAVKIATTRAAVPVSTSGGSAVTSGFSHPAPGSVKTQGIHGYNAVDLAGAPGLSIRAAAAGEVIVSKSGGWNGGYGNYIVIRHADGTQTLYAHLSYNSVGVGAYVSQGEVIGSMGNTGRSTGTHLHFEVRGGRNPF